MGKKKKKDEVTSIKLSKVKSDKKKINKLRKFLKLTQGKKKYQKVEITADKIVDNKILLIATGSLHSVLSSNLKLEMPGVSHIVSVEVKY